MCCNPPCNQAQHFDAHEGKLRTITYDSTGSFLSRLNAAVFDHETADKMKTTVVHALGTLDEVFTLPEMNLTPVQLGTLGIDCESIP